MSETQDRKNLDCPKCVGKLQKNKVENVEIDVCFLCEGIWFDAGELEAVIKADSKDFVYVDVGRESFDGAELKAAGIDLDKEIGKCPVCNDGTELVKRLYDEDDKNSIAIDLCPKGLGVWLDGSEIQEIRRRGNVNFVKSVESFFDFIKYCFSRDGFGGLMRMQRGGR